MRAGSAEVIGGMAHLQVFWRTDVTLPLIQTFLSSRI
jgi:hypothetical protein